MRKIVILGFAGSRVEAPFADPTWEIWGCNDVYNYVPRVDATFELHHLQNLGNRRNPKYEEWMRNGCPSGPKPQTSLFVIAPNPAWPTANAFPFENVRMAFNQLHGTDYFTSSIALMLALAILELTDETTANYEDGTVRKLRVAKPGAELAMFGVDMAAESEYASQRPCVEYFTGLARGMGISVFIPDTSDICKSSAVYGIGTTAPLAIKARSKIEEGTQAKVQLMQQMQQLQAQQVAIAQQMGQVEGARDVWKYIERCYTQPTDIQTGEKLPAKDRTLPELPVQTNGHKPAPVGG